MHLYCPQLCSFDPIHFQVGFSPLRSRERTHANAFTHLSRFARRIYLFVSLSASASFSLQNKGDGQTICIAPSRPLCSYFDSISVCDQILSARWTNGLGQAARIETLYSRPKYNPKTLNRSTREFLADLMVFILGVEINMKIGFLEA